MPIDLLNPPVLGRDRFCGQIDCRMPIDLLNLPVQRFDTILDFGLGKLCAAMVSVCKLPRLLFKSGWGSLSGGAGNR